MLSLTRPDQSPEGHRRQNSTPTTATDSPKPDTIDTNNRDQRIHRRGLSLDQTITPRNANILSNSQKSRTSVEDLFQQQWSENHMQETQHTPNMARPGQRKSNTNHLQQQHAEQKKQQQTQMEALSPCLEHGGIGGQQMSDLIRYWEASSGHLFRDDANARQSMISNGSAGYLDGFGAEFEKVDPILLSCDASQNLQPGLMRSTAENLACNASFSGASSRPETPLRQIEQGRLLWKRKIESADTHQIDFH